MAGIPMDAGLFSSLVQRSKARQSRCHKGHRDSALNEAGKGV
jgi:hypothetical protein